MDKGTESGRAKGIMEPGIRQNSENAKGEEESLETDVERAKVPPMGSKGKVTDLGWQARTVLTRLQWFERSCWKDQEVIGARGKAFSNSGWRERGSVSSLLGRATKRLL